MIYERKSVGEKHIVKTYENPFKKFYGRELIIKVWES